MLLEVPVFKIQHSCFGQSFNFAKKCHPTFHTYKNYFFILLSFSLMMEGITLWSMHVMHKDDLNGFCRSSSWHLQRDKEAEQGKAKKQAGGKRGQDISCEIKSRCVCRGLLLLILVLWKFMLRLRGADAFSLHPLQWAAVPTVAPCCAFSPELGTDTPALLWTKGCYFGMML